MNTKQLFDQALAIHADLVTERANHAETKLKLADVLRELAAIESVRRPSVDDVHTLIRAMAGGEKIEAIKAYRMLTGYGLKESKDAVETVMNQIPRAQAA